MLLRRIVALVYFKLLCWINICTQHSSVTWKYSSLVHFISIQYIFIVYYNEQQARVSLNCKLYGFFYTKFDQTSGVFLYTTVIFFYVAPSFQIAVDDWADWLWALLSYWCFVCTYVMEATKLTTTVWFIDATFWKSSLCRYHSEIYILSGCTEAKERKYWVAEEAGESSWMGSTNWKSTTKY